MGISIINMILIVLFLGITPVLLGNTICRITGINTHVSKSYVVGYITVWALLQLITVPLVMLKQSFMMVVILTSLTVLILIIYGLVKKCYSCQVVKPQTTSDKLMLVLMLLVIASLLVVTTVMQHTDADDSRFVVNAVDIVRTNKMFLTNPATGEAIPRWTGELVKDVTSPWAVFIAYCATLTGVHPTIMAHTVLPLVLTLILCIVYWMISDVFFKDDISGRSIFVIIAILLNVYGYYSIYSAETFAITRIWQGKAVVASIGIPLMYYICTQIYDDIKGYYALLYMQAFAMCLMSGMGIIIAAMISGAFGFIYGILKKDIKLFFRIVIAAIPCAIYFCVYFAQKGGI